jgi:O-antigen/teichoic acid export membrane protein
MSWWNNRRPRQRVDTAQASSAIAGNTVWNLLGTGLPLLLAVVSVPILIGAIGVERFGILTIGWAILSYFGLFDLGLGRATTKFLAEALEDNRVVEGRALFWTSILLNGLLGLVSAAGLAVLAPLLVREVLNVPAPIEPEIIRAFYLMAAAVPLVTVTTALRGTLEAQHRFALLNLLQVPTSTLTQAAPLLVLPFSHSLIWLIGALALSRVLGLVVYFVGALRQIESPFEGPFFARGKLRAMFSFGGWITVTNTVVPFMFNADKFVIGSLSSMAAVTYYSTPYEAVIKFWILSQSLVRTMFPIFSTKLEIEQRTRLYTNAVRMLTLVLAPVVATLIVFAPEILRLWVGGAFVAQSSLVLQILAIGVFVHSLALMPYNLIQGLGRPDITAKFHLLETPFYLLMLWYGVQYFGIVGAAVAWSVRLGVDALLLVLYVRFTALISLQTARHDLLRQALALSASLLALGWLLDALASDLVFKLGGWLLILGAALFVSWRRFLAPEERKRLAGYNSKPWALVRAFNPRKRIR